MRFSDRACFASVRTLAERAGCSERGRKAHHVHHAIYPTTLGEEELDWLYTLCARHHLRAHHLAYYGGHTLLAATERVIAECQ